MIRLLEELYEPIAGLEYEKISNNEVRITKYTGRKRTLAIPAEIDGCAVTEISAYAFTKKNCLQEVVLPPTVTCICASAFSECRNLRAINLSGVTEIEDHAFYECVSLECVKLASGLKKLSAGIFGCCKSLATVNLPSGLQSIGNACFRGCETLRDIVLPNSLRELGDSVFEECTSLKSLDFPNSVEVFGYRMFAGSGIQKFGLPQSLTAIPEKIFIDSNIASITLPRNIKHICWDAFGNCQSLQSIILPEGLLTIEESAFRNCKALKEIVVPSTVKEIGSLAFWASGLEDIVFDGDTSRIDIAPTAFMRTPYERKGLSEPDEDLEFIPAF